MLGAAPTLESNYWFGAQGNRLWVGQVECDGINSIDNSKLEDPDGSNRVKVRIMGYHTRSRDKLKPNELPWASVMMPATETVTRDGAGTVHSLINGMWVLGLFMDGESAQQPVVLGSLGIVDKDQPYQDRLDALGLNNDYVPPDRVLEQRDSLKSPTGNSQANRGGHKGLPSAADRRQKSNEQVTLGVANAKCGPRPENEFTRILTDLFKFLSNNERVGNKVVDKLTGNVVKSGKIISAYVGRLANAVNGLLGDTKALVVRELKKYLQKFFQPLIQALLPKQSERGPITQGIVKAQDILFEAIKCIFQTIFEKVVNLIINIVTKLVDDVLNTAFCQVSNILKGIVKEIQGGITKALKALGQVFSFISKLGNFGGGFIKALGQLLKLFCDGKLSCVLGIGEFTTGVGEKPDNSVDAFLNNLETFGGAPNALNVGLYGSDSFLSGVESTKLIGSDGKVVTGSLDCNRATSFNFPNIPKVFFTGITKNLNNFSFNSDTGSIVVSPNGDRSGTFNGADSSTFGSGGTGTGNGTGVNVGTPLTVNGVAVSSGGTGGTPLTVGSTGGTPVIFNGLPVVGGGTGGTSITSNGEFVTSGSLPITIGATGGTPVSVGGTGGSNLTVDGNLVTVGGTGGNTVIIGLVVGTGSGTGSGTAGFTGGTTGNPETLEDAFNDNPYPPSSYDGNISGPGSNDDIPRGIPAINSFGEVVGVVITNPGFGLDTPPNVTIYPFPGWGGGAEGFTTLDNNGGVASVVITNTGNGYPYFNGSVSNSDVVPTNQNGDPDYTKISGAYVENEFWLGIITEENPPEVIRTGGGYDETCAIIVEPGEDEVNDVILPELKPIIEDGFLTGVQVIKPGFGFTVLPKMFMSCGSLGVGLGDQRRAKIIPTLKYIPRKDANLYLTNYNEFREYIDCVGHPGE